MAAAELDIDMGEAIRSQTVVLIVNARLGGWRRIRFRAGLWLAAIGLRLAGFGAAEVRSGDEGVAC